GFLSVEVEYSGSCELHEFSLCYKPIVGSGNGAETRLHLTHHDPGAACDDVVQTSLVFDLYPITENEGVGEVFVQLGPHRVRYTAPWSGLRRRNRPRERAPLFRKSAFGSSLRP